MLKIRMLGRTRIEYGGESIDAQMSNKTQALIYLLLLNYGKFLAREKAQLYLWPDSTEEAAKYNLRYNLWLLKKTLPKDGNGQSLILAEKDVCSINTAYELECDFLTIRAFESETDSLEALCRIKSLFTGEVLEGWYLKNCSEYNEMILFERMLCETKHIEILKCLAGKYSAAGEYAKALSILQEILQIEPDNETVEMRIIENYAKAGNRVAAINHYRAFEANLWSDLSITPNEKLRTAYLRLLETGQSAAVPPKTPAAAQKAPPPPAVKDTEKPGLTLRGHCIPSVDYFFLSDIISKSLKAIDTRLLAGFDAAYINDIAYIQRDIVIEYNLVCENPVKSPPGELLNVRIIGSAAKYFEFLSRHYDVHILFPAREKLDALSASALDYLASLELDHLHINMQESL